MQLPALAKVNLYLEAAAPLESGGLHPLTTIMTPIDFGDSISIEESDAWSLSFDEAPSCPLENTTIYKAAHHLAAALEKEPNFAIKVKKRIPEQAGLGGGSADAGAVLRALAWMWQLDVQDPKVVEAARAAGSDTVFFLTNTCALMGGFGDELVEELPKPNLPLVVIKAPKAHSSTPAVYEAFDDLVHAKGEATDMIEALCAHAQLEIARCLFNNLAQASASLCSAVLDELAWLREDPEVIQGCVCGSGAACFGVCYSPDCAERVARRAQEAGYWAQATKTI